MKEKVLYMQKAALALNMVMLSGWAAAAAGQGTITYVVIGVTVGLVTSLLLRKKVAASGEADPYLRLAAAYGSILAASCVLILVQAAQYHREGAFSPWFGYLIAAILIPQAVFPALLRAGGE